MENQQELTKTSNPATWVILIIVIIIALGVGAYFLFFQEGGTNTNNANTTVNTNAITNENVNAVSNTNTETNTNVVANTNRVTNVTSTFDTTDWQTYFSEKNGWYISYPSDWIIAVSSDVDHISFWSPDKFLTVQGGGNVPINGKSIEDRNQDLREELESKENGELIMVDGYSGLKYIASRGEFVTKIERENDKLIFSMGASGGYDLASDKENNMELFDAFIASIHK